MSEKVSSTFVFYLSSSLPVRFGYLKLLLLILVFPLALSLYCSTHSFAALLAAPNILLDARDRSDCINESYFVKLD